MVPTDVHAASTDDFARFGSARHFHCLDGLRACAVMWVVLYHCPDLGIDWWDEWRHAGDLGVDLFFVISGFLITTLILREPPAPLGGRLARFYMRRVLRIFPVYYFAIGVYWVATRTLAPARLGVYEGFVPWLLAYLSDYRLCFEPIPFPVFGHAWSLAVEEKFYIFWPVLVMLLSWRRGMLGCAVLIVLAIVLRFAVVSRIDDDHLVAARLYYAFDTRFDSLMWGALLAYALRHRAWFGLLHRLIRPSVMLVALVLLMLYGPFASNDSHRRYLTIPVLCATIVAGYLLRPSAFGQRVLDSRPMIYIGRISYGIYIFHPLAISVAKRAGDAVSSHAIVSGILAMIVAVVLSVAIAAISFRYFESWFLRLKSRFRDQAQDRSGRAS